MVLYNSCGFVDVFSYALNYYFRKDLKMLERKFSITPAWDKRSIDPDKDYGIHCMDLSFKLIGAKGGISCYINTGWYLRDNFDLVKDSCFKTRYPWITGLFWHSKEPLYSGQEVSREECDITGGVCYCDGTSLNTSLENKFLAEGDSAIWSEMEEMYERVFETKE